MNSKINESILKKVVLALVIYRTSHISVLIEVNSHKILFKHDDEKTFTNYLDYFLNTDAFIIDHNGACILSESFNDKDICFEFKESKLFLSNIVLSIDEIKDLEDKFNYVISNYNLDIQLKEICLSDNSADTFIKKKENFLNEKIPFLPLQIYNQLNSERDYVAVLDKHNSYSNKELLDLINKSYILIEKYNLPEKTTIILHGQLDAKMIASSIAIWLKGYTVVLLDSELGDERKRQILSSINPALIISKTIDNSFNYNQAIFKEINTVDSTKTININEPQNWHKIPAYITFTSGSTGEPKGILSSHKGFSHFINWQKQEFNINETHRCGQFTSMTFDVIYRSVFTPLLGGATLLLSPFDVFESQNIVTWMSKNKITMFNIVPSVLNFWLDTTQVEELKNLKYIFSAGEKLTNSLLKKLKVKWRYHSYVINFYGPSEATLAKFYKKISNNQNFTQEIIDVGQPIPNTNVYIFNYYKKCSLNEVGEVVIKTPFMSFGYLNYDNKNFRVVDINNPEDVYYFTGDLGKITLDGDLLIIDRIDNQVKINGIRIELGEIESIVAQSNYTKESAVVFYDDKLFLFIVPQLSDQNIKDSLEKFLEKELPEYMLPTEILIEGSLPKNKNGKLDRILLSERLKLILKNKSSLQELDINELTEEEYSLLDICEKILDTNIDNIEDSFLKIGFNSILLIKLVFDIQKQFLVKLSIKEIYKHNSIKKLVKRIFEKTTEYSNTIFTKAKQKQKFPATHSQKRIFFSSKIDSSGKAYNIISAFKIKGCLNVARFEKALSTVVESNNILKSYFQLDSDRFDLIIPEFHELNFLKLKISENQINTQIQAINKKFELEQGPLYIFALFEINQEDFVFAYNIHHSIFDGQSHQILLKQLWNFYFDNKLPNTSFEYNDYAYFEDNFIKNNSDNLNYWLNNLKDAPILELPVEQTRPIEKNHKGNLLSVRISDEIQSKLSNLAINMGITDFSLLMSAFSLIIRKYSMQEDFVVGIPSIGRSIEETQDMIGMFVETLPVRIRPEGNKQFSSFAIDLHKTILESLDNPYPFDDIINKLNLKQQGVRNPLIDVMFTFWEGATQFRLSKSSSLELLSIKEIHNQTSKFDILCYLDINFDGWFINFEYDINLFSDELIKRMLNNFIVILDDISKGYQNKKIKEINCISRIEKYLILNELSYTPFELIKNTNFIDLFYIQVNKSPNNLAVVDSLQSLTYKQLDILSDTIAHKLKQLTNKENFIPIYMERSVYMTASILAILKNGMVYVPIDLAYPIDRIKYILKDCCAKTIISNVDSAKKFATQNSINLNIICIDELAVQYEKFDNIKVNDETPFVLFYTSGTTGNPKGVIQKHQALVNFANYENTVNDINENDKVAFYSSFGFDVSMWSLLLPLLKGAASYIVPEEVRFSLYDLNDYFEKNNITVALLPTQLCENFISLIDNKSLRLLWTAGERLKKYTDRPYRLINGYGPTEYTGCTTRYEVTQSHEHIPIGRPLGNTWIYLLSQYHELQPIGANGELCISGVQLANGYLNLPDENSQKFIYNPFTTNKINQKLYKTGDIARWQSNGELIYLGRSDHQLKIRGYRVELEEIENALSSILGVSQNCVLYKDKSANKYLACYYMLKNKELSKKTILEKLSNKLPEYMIPSVLVEVEEFKLTANGKLDKKALPDVEFVNEDKYVAPESELEKSLCTIWQEVLGLEKIGIENDFFSLGGNSILAIRLSHIISKELDTNFSVADVFKYKSILNISEHISNTSGPQILIPKLEKDSYELSYAQERLWFIEQYEQGTNAYHIPVLLSLEDINIKYLKKSIESIVKRHEILRSVFVLESDSDIQVVKENTLIIEEKNIKKSVFKEEIKLDINKVFNLREEYPIRVIIYDVDGEYKLLITVHHIAFDGWSIEVFEKELEAYYFYYKDGNILNLPELEIQYKDYAIWQRDYLTGHIYREHVSYWKNKLLGYESLNMITDYMRPNEIDYRGSRIVFEINKEISTKLRDIAKKNGCSLYSLLLSIFYVLLSRYSNQQDISIGSPIANRHYRQVKDLIGFFVNNVVLREWINLEEDILELTQRVHKDLIDIQSYQDIPFEKLIEELNVERDQSRHPIFQVMFGVQSFGRNTTNNSLFKTHDIREVYEVSKFDLECFIDESEEILRGSLVYSIVLYKESTIKRLANSYIYLLEQLTKEENKKIKDYKLLSKEDYDQIVYKWNESSNEYLNNQTIYKLFEEQVARNPDNIALVFEEQKLTYKELNKRSNQLARYIRLKYELTTKQDLEPDTLISLCIDRGLDTIVSIFGIMKAGGAYVPIDPEYPIERINHIIEDMQSKLLITQNKYVNKFSNQEAINLIVLDKEEIAQEIENQDGNNLLAQNQSTDLAYVIYTSGTTGLPKGVMIEHQSVVEYLSDIKIYFNKDISNVDFSTNIAFDLTVTTIYGALLNNKKLIIYSNKLNDVNKYILHLKENKIDFIKTTPSYANAIYSIMPKIKKAFLGGEKLEINLLKKLLNKISIVIDEYGPTEATVGSHISVKSDKSVLNNSIGKNYPNNKSYILDEDKNPVAIGIIGELYIGGAGLSRGYLNRPDLTREKFIDNPFATDKDRNKGYTRLYKTGDLVRWLEDGNIEYIGRNDDQVKIHGYRIALGEVENSLSSIAGISKSCVLCKERNDYKYLVGYYKLDNKYLNKETISEKLSNKLPEYMIPSILVEIEEFKLTINGKVDKKALPDPKLVDENKYVAPESSLEQTLCSIWQEVLGLDKIGTADDFFKIGGNSILAIRLAHKISNGLDISFSVASIFKNKTIKNTALYVTVCRNNKSNKKYKYLDLIDDFNYNKSTLLLIHGIGGNIASYNSIVQKLRKNYNICIFEQDSNSFPNSYKEMIKEYKAELDDFLVFNNLSEINIIGWSYGVAIALSLLDCLSKNITCNKCLLIDEIPYLIYKHNNNLSFDKEILTENNIKNLITIYGKENKYLRNLLNQSLHIDDLLNNIYKAFKYYETNDLSEIRNNVSLIINNIRNYYIYVKSIETLPTLDRSNFYYIYLTKSKYINNYESLKVYDRKKIKIIKNEEDMDHYSILKSENIIEIMLNY